MSEADPFTRTRLGQLQEKIKLFANRSIINGDANEIRYLIFWNNKEWSDMHPINQSTFMIEII